MPRPPVTEKVFISGIVISMLLWGLSWPSAKVLSRYDSAVNLVAYRYVLVVLSLFPVLIFLKMGARIKKQGIPHVLASGVLLALYSYLFFEGLKHGAPGAGGVLVTTLNPIMAYAIGLVLSRKRPSTNEAIGLGLGLIAGAVLLRIWDNTAGIFSSGNLYFLLAAFTWAVMSKFTSRGGMYGTSVGFSLWQYIVTLLCLLPLTNYTEAQATLHIPDSVFWLNLIFSSVIVTTGATTVYFYATTRVGPEKASSFIFMVPLAAALSSWLFLGETILIHTLVGGILGIAAVYIINRRQVVQNK